MWKRSLGPSDVLLLAVSLLLCSCGTRDNVAPPASLAAGQIATAQRQGIVHSGLQPVSGAAIQLYAVGTGGSGSAAKPLLSPVPATKADGSFTIAGTYTCPSSAALVYLVATGGNPDLTLGTTNPAIAMMTALGPCDHLSASTSIVVNELTTVAAVSALAPYMHSLSAIGSDAAHAAALADAFTLASTFVNPATGTTPGTKVPPGATVPVQQLNTLADIAAGCINSSGGKAGDGSACGKLFALTAVPAGSIAPADTVAALLEIATNPTINVDALYDLIAPRAPYEPIQPQAPPDLAVRLLQPSGLTVSPAALSFPQTRVGTTTSPQTITITNNTGAPIALDAADPNDLNFAGADREDFGLTAPITGTCYAYSPLPPGASCTVQVTFRPTATGLRIAYYVLPNSSANPSIAVSLDGIGLPVGTGSAGLSTNSLNLQSAGTPASVTLTNFGAGPLTIDSIGISNDPTSGQPAFTETNTCVGRLAAGATCTISVTALSTTQLYSTGVLTVYDDAASGPQTLNLSYSNGFAGPILLTFPGLSVGTSFTDNLTLGTYINPVTFTITGPNATDFSFSATTSTQTTTCQATRSNPFCPAPITFTPSGLGARIATVNANGSPAGGFVGTGLAPGAHLAFLSNGGTSTPVSALGTSDFTPLPVVGQSGSDSVIILNTGTVPLTLNAPTLTGPAAAEFSATTTNCAATLVPGATCLLTITFTPAHAGPRTATLTLKDSTGAAYATLQLSVLGLFPPPVVNPSTLAFPYTPQGSVSAPLSFTITAYNNDPVIVKHDPAIAAVDPFVLNRGDSCSKTPCKLSLRYEPTSSTYTNGSGGFTYGNLYIYDQITYQYTLLSAQGTFVAPYVLSASPTSLHFGTQPYGSTSNPQMITLTNTGSQDIHYSLAFNASGTATTDPNFQAVADSTEQLVQAGNTDDVYVTFCPTVHGKDTATLYILSQARPIAIQLSGTSH